MSAARSAEALTRDRIIDAALALARKEGAAALSMRRIAAELGTGAMSLYNHVPDKEALLEGLVERIFNSVETPSGATWREVSTAWATSTRATVLANGPLLPILVGPRRGFPLLGLLNRARQALVDSGLETDEAREVTSIVSRWVIGSVMADAAMLRGGLAPRDQLDELFAQGLDALHDGLACRLDTGGS
jgi:AcrR family transcriptional regulator